ncbi:uncharacterized protein KQ657_000798 [Scheffersomyces spartinae]|uniref:Dephospho-CoA kinase n=1 Tax=Scheffersomyces spartinae TaxID=45513 RepID=A0A9P8AI55_9ASCO|nr:uncharacterized protein KQ657_000798 [Scheffersomyces spartinae]KAG7193380.1 hypothetical protein KQ657_000798 [Scheffersomyces spartinae]
MLIVGLTGGISTGKSTVSARLRDNFGVPVVDADQIAREVVQPGKRAYNQIVEAFGSEIDDLVNESDQSLNRTSLGSYVFGNRERLAILNGIVHPAVKRAIAWGIFHAYLGFNRMVVLDVPLLFESGLDKMCGIVVTVACDEDTQLARLLKRNQELSAEDAQKRIASQMPMKERNYKSDIVIDNLLSLDDLYASIDAVVSHITPGFWITLLDLVTPIGGLSALFTFILRRINDRFKSAKAKTE